MGLIPGKEESFLYPLIHFLINSCNLTRLYYNMLYPCGIRCERIVGFPKDAFASVVQGIQVNEMVTCFLNIYKMVVLHVRTKIMYHITLYNIDVQIQRYT